MRVTILFKIICVFCLWGVLSGCNNDENLKHISTNKLADNVYIELFYISYGVHAGGEKKYFVTDSVSYRTGVGTCDDKQYLSIELCNSKLIIEKHSRRNLKRGKSKIIKTETIDLDRIKSNID
jgi:hypothetical protein